MTEHTIRLRAGWQCWRDGDDASTARRVDLPGEWVHRCEGPLRLARTFHRPPLEPGRERMALRLDAVPGLAEVRLNGERLAALDPPTAAGPIVLPLPAALPPRNRLELRVERPGPGAGGGPPEPWGQIALEIHEVTGLFNSR